MDRWGRSVFPRRARRVGRARQMLDSRIAGREPPAADACRRGCLRASTLPLGARQTRRQRGERRLLLEPLEALASPANLARDPWHGPRTARACDPRPASLCAILAQGSARHPETRRPPQSRSAHCPFLATRAPLIGRRETLFAPPPFLRPQPSFALAGHRRVGHALA